MSSKNHTEIDRLLKEISADLESIQILTKGKARTLAEQIMIKIMPRLRKLCQRD